MINSPSSVGSQIYSSASAVTSSFRLVVETFIFSSNTSTISSKLTDFKGFFLRKIPENRKKIEKIIAIVKIVKLT